MDGGGHICEVAGAVYSGTKLGKRGAEVARSGAEKANRVRLATQKPSRSTSGRCGSRAEGSVGRRRSSGPSPLPMVN